jgi:hypothetical protein
VCVRALIATAQGRKPWALPTVAIGRLWLRAMGSGHLSSPFHLWSSRISASASARPD